MNGCAQPLLTFTKRKVFFRLLEWKSHLDRWVPRMGTYIGIVKARGTAFGAGSPIFPGVA